MERSLRATGCDLPLRIIPFSQTLFTLPPNSEWIDAHEYYSVVRSVGAMGYANKFVALTRQAYQFIDCDAVFLSNPAIALADCDGFVATCTQWKLPQYAYCLETLAMLEAKSTTWLGRVFNSGQFACDRELYTIADLIRLCHDKHMKPLFTRQKGPYDQPAFNLLVASTEVPIVNLTLPPFRMESSWAGDYLGEFEHLWHGTGRKPYLMHWAGGMLFHNRPINRLFLDFLTSEEEIQWNAIQLEHHNKEECNYISGLSILAKTMYFAKKVGKKFLKYCGFTIPIYWLKKRSNRRSTDTF